VGCGQKLGQSSTSVSEAKENSYSENVIDTQITQENLTCPSCGQASWNTKVLEVATTGPDQILCDCEPQRYGVHYIYLDDTTYEGNCSACGYTNTYTDSENREKMHPTPIGE
jgi:ribosomal protein L37E